MNNYDELVKVLFKDYMDASLTMNVSTDACGNYKEFHYLVIDRFEYQISKELFENLKKKLTKGIDK